MTGSAELPSEPDWANLPEPVRRRLLSWAADALGHIPAGQIPAGLRSVARFTAAKRAKLGAAALSYTLTQDPGFRATVAESIHTSGAAAATDPISAAAAGYLFSSAESGQLLAIADQISDQGALRAQLNELRSQVQRAEATISRLTDELSRQGPDGEQAATLESEAGQADKLRRRLREQGVVLRHTRDELAQAHTQSENQAQSLLAQVQAVEYQLKLMTDRAEAARLRAEKAEALVSELQAMVSAGQASADRRVELLLDTIRDAQAGLRAELRLSAEVMDPAEAVMRAMPTAVRGDGRVADAQLLTSWLALPQAHLIVDGYNITKSGYPDLTLADQRDRLVRQLSALGARTGAEITVVFDGAAVIGHQTAGRGVRVLFSPPGVIADEVIKNLVAAEPVGRVLVVATSDREIVTNVRAKGARTVSAPVLLSLWGAKH